MKRLLLLVTLVVSLSCPLTGQQTVGYHRISQVIARGNSGVTAQVVPYAKINVTNTATGTAAAIYSDPLLTAVISPPTITADASGNYSYYIALSYCVTESISSPGQGFLPTANICQLGGGGGGGAPGGANTDVQVNVLGSFGGYGTLTYSPLNGLNVGALNCAVSNCVTVGPQGTVPSPWVFNLQTPATACASIGCSGLTGIQANGISVVTSGGNINFTSGAGVSLSISGNAVQITASASSLSWTSITAGTNPNALLVSGSLGPTGPGQIIATNLTGNITQSQVTGLAATLATYLLSSTAATTYAPINSPTLTGTPLTPTPGSCGSSTQIINELYGHNCFLTSVITQTNCLTTACVGNSGGSAPFYVSGTTYTNSSGVPLTEEVTMLSTGSCTGSDARMTTTIGGVVGPSASVTNDCNGTSSVTFLVPAGATFSVTVAQYSGGPATITVSSWLEIKQ